MRKQLKDKKPVLNGKVKELLNKSLPELQKRKHELSTTQTQATTVLKSEVEKLSEYHGIPISKEDKESILNVAMQHTHAVSTKDGIKYDTETGIKTALLLKYNDNILKKVKEDAFREGALAFAKKRFGPNATDGSTAAAGAEQKKSKSEDIKSAIKEHTGKK
jgi:hypothetical protein